MRQATLLLRSPGGHAMFLNARSAIAYMEMLASAGKLGLTIADVNLGIFDAAYGGFVRGILKSLEQARSVYNADQLCCRSRFVN